MNDSILQYTLCFAASLAAAPLLPGIINKVKAFFAGRRGPSVVQLYYDLFKLVRKENIISSSSGGIIRLAPVMLLALTCAAALLLPAGFASSPLGFNGDVLLFFYLLGSARMISVLAALDTGSSFEGMGASREVFFSAIAEAAVFAVLAFLVLFSSSADLSLMLCGRGIDSWMTFTPALLASLSMFLIMLAENCRVPFDDPETHLELTMIHEAMILDFSGSDLALVLYASSLKLWLFASFITSMLIPPDIMPLWAEILIWFVGIISTAAVIGAVESAMARYRFLKVPPLLAGAIVLPVLAMLFLIFFADGGVL